MPANVRRLLIANIPKNYRHVHYVQADENGTHYTYAVFPVAEATPADVTTAFVVQCEVDGRAKQQRDTIARAEEYGMTGFADGFRTCLGDLGIAALLVPPDINTAAGQESERNDA